MEIEQVVKRLEWLDEERRKDKTSIATLEDKLQRMEGNLRSAQKEIKDLHKDLAQINTIQGRQDQFDTSLSALRVDLGRTGESLQRIRTEIEVDQDSKRRSEIDSINKSIIELRKSNESLADIKKSLKKLEDEHKKIADVTSEIDEKVVQSRVIYEEFQRAQKLNDESRKVDNKRMTDMQGEISAFRKRMDEQRSRVDLLIENIKKVENRLTDLIQSESDRRQAQVAFIERQNQAQVERDRTWKDMQSRFTTVENIAGSIETQVQGLEEMLRSVKKSKDQLDDATQRIERRVNEITEMHRLNEDHFRQEWTAFKADEQKRWTNYNLVAEEQLKDAQRQYDKHDLRLVQLEDLSQQLNDQFSEFSEETQKRLRSLLDLSHTWVSSYERLFGQPTDSD